jgi:hypothetical protein
MSECSATLHENYSRSLIRLLGSSDICWHIHKQDSLVPTGKGQLWLFDSWCRMFSWMMLFRTPALLWMPWSSFGVQGSNHRRLNTTHFIFLENTHWGAQTRRYIYAEEIKKIRNSFELKRQ